MTSDPTMPSPVGELLLVGLPAQDGVRLTSVSMDGGLRGYAGGAERKQQLLAHEGVLLGASW